MRVLLLCVVAVAQQACDPGYTGSCSDASGTNCCLGVNCDAGSQCASGQCTGSSVRVGSSTYGACVAAAGSKGLAGYYCEGSGNGDNSLCNSGKCIKSFGGYICEGSGTGAALVQAGGYCSKDPAGDALLDGFSLTQAEVDSQCASGLVCSGNTCTAAPTFAPTDFPTPPPPTPSPTDFKTATPTSPPHATPAGVTPTMRPTTMPTAAPTPPAAPAAPASAAGSSSSSSSPSGSSPSAAAGGTPRPAGAGAGASAGTGSGSGSGASSGSGKSFPGPAPSVSSGEAAGISFGCLLAAAAVGMYVYKRRPAMARVVRRSLSGLGGGAGGRGLGFGLGVDFDDGADHADEAGHGGYVEMTDQIATAGAAAGVVFASTSGGYSRPSNDRHSLDTEGHNTSILSAAPTCTALAVDHRGTLSRKVEGKMFGSGWSDVTCEWSADGKELKIAREGSSAAEVLRIDRWFQFPPRENKKEHRFDLLMTHGQVESFAAPTETDFEEWVSCLEGSEPAAKLSEHPNYTPEWDLGNLNLQYKTLTEKLEKAKTQNKLELAVKLQQQLHALTKTKDKAEKLRKEITELNSSASFGCLQNSQQKARELSDLVAGTRQSISVKFGTAAWIKRMSKFEISYADIELSTQELGKGASSVVVKGKCLGVDVAIKQLTPGNTNAEKKHVQKMLQKETKALERLNHPNVVSMLHVSIDDPENPSIVLELAEKGSVWKVLQEDPTIPQWQRVKFVCDIANGMSMVHRRNLVHHDLKPDNCLVTNEMVVKVSDLGTATGTSATFRGTASPTTSNSVGGTLNYSAPEVLNQTEELRDKPAVDTYAFGITLLEILTGERVWTGKRPTDVNLLVLKNKRPPIPASVPHQLQNLIKRCWAADPTSRPTFTEISLELAQLQKQDGFQPPSSAVHVEVMTIVVSTAAIGLGGERIMEYVEAMCKVYKGLVLGYDWANSSSADERDSTSIDWKDSTSVAKSFWFKGYCERVKGQLLLMAQLPFTRVEVVCIEGGPISQLEARSMSKLTTDVQNDLATKGLQAQLDVKTISFAEFKQRFNAGEVHVTDAAPGGHG